MKNTISTPALLGILILVFFVQNNAYAECTAAQFSVRYIETSPTWGWNQRHPNNSNQTLSVPDNANQQITASISSGMMTLSISNIDASNHTDFYIDTDNNSSTGYGDMGAEYRIVDSTLQRYNKAEVNQWDWYNFSYVDTVTRRETPHSTEVDLPISKLTALDIQCDGEATVVETLTLAGTLRDFHANHPNFEPHVAGTNDWSNFDGVVTEMVQSTLGNDKKPVFNGSSKSTTNATHFNQWYNDTAGVNQSKSYSLILEKQSDNVYTYDSIIKPKGNTDTLIGFFPLDGELFGNEGNPHNYHMTYEVHSQFTYQGGEVFSFSGDDDVWVFINNQLAVDIGGIHVRTAGSVNLDSLGLTQGETYAFDMFWAERQTVQSNFKISTTIALQNESADHGDAPESYGDAEHVVDNGDNLYIGNIRPDIEEASAYSYNAMGDGDEDDGAPRHSVGSTAPYLFPILKESANSYSMDVKVTNNSGNTASLFAWIDFNNNGTFDSNESTSAVVYTGVSNTAVTLNWNTIPNDIQISTTFIRLRLTTDSAVTLITPSNKASDGEVEDYMIAVAQDIPPNSPNVTVLKDIDPRECETVVFSDNFDDLPSTGTYIGEHRPNKTTIRDWVMTGGGNDTYASTVHLNSDYAQTVGYTIDDYGTSVYLGNGAVRRVYPSISNGLSFDANNRLITSIEAIEQRDNPDDSTQGETPENNKESDWGPTAVKLSRTFDTEVGKTYRLYFKALPELGNYQSGIVRIDTPAGSVHVKTPGTSEGEMIKYAIEFTATEISSTVSFVNYGHVNANSGGWCAPWTNPWCTVDGTNGYNTNEVTLDDIVIAESDCANECSIDDINTGIYSSSSVLVNSHRLNSATRLYQAQFDIEVWEGYLLSYNLKTADNNNHGNTKDLKWDAAEQIPSHNQRSIFSYNPLLATSNKGIEFTWDNLNVNQKGLLSTEENNNSGGGSSVGNCDAVPEWVNSTVFATGNKVKHNNKRYEARWSTSWNNPDSHGTEVNQHGVWTYLGACEAGTSESSSEVTDIGLLSWIRGDQSKEKTSANAGGIFHHRTRLLGDIIHSSPVYTSRYDNFGYSKLSGSEGTSYLVFLTSKRNRTEMIYVGSNDGMLHGFDAISGEERFAYIPNEVMPKFIKISDPNYGCHETDCLAHEALVDGEFSIGDAYINSAWHTVLLGNLGAGGKGIFALDVTDPTNFNTSKVMWELSANQASDSASTYANYLGETIPNPSIVRLNDGSWAAIVSNGYNSESHKAVLLLIDISNGDLIKAINTEQGTANTPNGLSSPIPIDTNGDRVTDLIYAGDLYGNMWKFDVSSSNADNWSVAYTESSLPAPLFTACETSSCTQKQAITAKPQIGKHPNGGYMVYFSTGKYFDPSDNVSGTPNIETLYGIRDNGSRVSSLNDLLVQTVLQESTLASDLKARVTSNNTVNYASKKGWLLKLLKADGTREGERIISQALLRGGKLILTTLTPPENCGWNGSSWLMEINAINGKRLPMPALDVNNDRQFNNNDKVVYDEKSEVPSGLKKDSLGLILHSPVVINHTSSSEGKYVSGSTGTVGMFRESSSRASGRQSWKQIR